MFRRLLTILAGSLLILVAAFVLSLTIRVKAPVESYPDVPTYAARGPHRVGVRTLTADGDTPLDITMWYPALQDDTHPDETTYPYEIKMGPPLGSVALATFTGQAVREAPYDLTAGPYPLVILSPGFAFSSTTYAWQAEHLASYGFVVMAPEHVETLDPENDLWQSTITRPQDVLAVFAYVDRQIARVDISFQ